MTTTAFWRSGAKPWRWASRQVFGVQHHGGQVEFVLQLQRPLLAQRSGADDQQLPLALGPVLAEHDARLDGFAQTHLVGQQHALAQRRAQRKHRSLDLVGVQVHAGVKKRLAQTLEPAACVLQGQVVRDVFGLVGGEVHPSASLQRKPSILPTKYTN